MSEKLSTYAQKVYGKLYEKEHFFPVDDTCAAIIFTFLQSGCSIGRNMIFERKMDTYRTIFYI